MRKSIIWIPVLFVGSMVYWTLAVGLGGLSLVSVTADSFPCRSSLLLESGAGGDSPGDFLNNDEGGAAPSTVKDPTFQSITVKLGNTLDLTDQGADLSGAGAVTVDLVSDHAVAGADDGAASGNESSAAGATDNDDPDRRGSGRRSRTDQGPGETAF